MTVTTNDKVCIINTPGVHFPINEDACEGGIRPLHALGTLSGRAINATANQTTFMPAPVILYTASLPQPPDTFQ